MTGRSPVIMGGPARRSTPPSPDRAAPVRPRNGSGDVLLGRRLRQQHAERRHVRTAVGWRR